MKLFTPIILDKLSVNNRLVMPPMCTYNATNGLANELHYAHYSARALGGVGLIIVEATGVCPEGRITEQCLGLWNDEQEASLKELVRRVHALGSKIAIQLNHAGRKSRAQDWTVAPSSIPFDETYPIPKELTEAEIEGIIERFKESSLRAERAGFDSIEIHAAHGYLLHEFLSPLSNHRTDRYGIDRGLLLKEVMEAIRSVTKLPIIVRLSATDWEGGLTVKDLYPVVKELKADLYDISTGGNIQASIPLYPGYQLPFSEEIKNSCGVKTIGGGLITTFDQAEEALQRGAADLIFMGRELLRNPFFLHETARMLGIKEEVVPKMYWRA
ncbi:NADH:flavin oxidoreductase/NADH oxidase [Guggenheimella bovis]